jgi:hypothetical protein
MHENPQRMHQYMGPLPHVIDKKAFQKTYYVDTIWLYDY